MASLVYRLHKIGMITEWQYRTLSIIIAAKNEFSKVFEKIFQQLWVEGVSKESIANDLKIYVEEIEKTGFWTLI